MQNSIRRHLILAGIAILILAGGVGGWAFTTELSGAIIAQGQVVVDSNVKKVQHPTGGIVGELRVKNGDRVKMGDILIRLDETQTRANLDIILRSLDEMAARQARAEAERDGAKTIDFPDSLTGRMDQPSVRRLVVGEQRLFEIKREGRDGLRAQLGEQVAQLREQIRGLVAQEEAKVKEIDWIKQELKGVRDLWSKNLVQFTRVTALERDGARLEGERGSLIASIAQAKGRIAETELKILQIDQDLRTEVGRELADIRAKVSELAERQVAADDQLKRIDIRAPQDGFVHQLTVFTVGGVISAQGEPIMLIVPETDALTVEAKIAPHEIDQVSPGQKAVLRFSAFNQHTTPELNGEVQLVSADVTADQRTGATYYTVRIFVPPNELARLKGLKLVPGMPVEGFIQTRQRTVMSYLVRPLSDHMQRAFRER
jgi:HlyD family secretion protein